MKNSPIVSAAIFIVAVLLMLLQLWFQLWRDDIFTKIMITLGAFLAISLVVSFVKKELKDSHRMKHGGDLDR